MANERAMTAESVSNVLDLARMRRQSGRLNIELYSGGRVQEGEIYLQAGQPVYVRLGPLVGQDALNRLLSWRNVQFTLQLDEPGTTPIGLPVERGSNTASLPSQAPTARNRTTANDVSNAISNSPGIEWQAPQKSDEGRDIQSLPLTRRQRYIYFLVDGRRTLTDLSRCTGKNVQEIELILRELQAQGLVII
ncbi:MAG TPA: DUF4388 domain-containing protein [Ktedonobacteraceae bacterium]|nr:DUF4388 domain-containing protein [Ktedonobacteraceae bacterium]